MADFYETCFLSHLPIRFGDPVVVLPLIHCHTGSTVHQYNAFDRFEPFGFPFRAIYTCQDTCTIDNIRPDPVNQTFFKKFSYHVHTTDSENQPVTEPFDAPVFTEFVRTCFMTEDYIYTSLDPNLTDMPDCPLTAVMVHAGLYDSLLKEMETRSDFYNQPVRTKHINRLQAEYADAKDYLKMSAEIPNTEAMQPRICEIVSRQLSDTFFPHMDFAHHMAPMMQLLLTHPEWESDIMKRSADLFMMLICLNYARISIGGTGGFGSLCSETHIQKIIAKFTMDFPTDHACDIV